MWSEWKPYGNTPFIGVTYNKQVFGLKYNMYLGKAGTTLHAVFESKSTLPGVAGASSAGSPALPASAASATRVKVL